mmetsp:Transcript_9594/g.10933  ORF Transcript_9594/g.10933 Transcript_9594/m.10933 type:complete len:265 (+) Transcript_9594:79-873(+)|eukprot:CAMPEP_0184021382 /NCGR_PEP_ID=MMETSP0954-20121128/9899_1 /TAXON_ID=627963 /ORGANISM="Aplanochytrium sp, Strain PBS07" /LENGTH=264 /DNA_ID=CAMNT_0026303399 /DNA_START=110 /DNA_END=904 /DNA_ORIENTATION=-
MAFTSTTSLALALQEAEDQELLNRFLKLPRILITAVSLKNIIFQLVCAPVLVNEKQIVLGMVQANGREVFVLQDVLSGRKEVAGLEELSLPSMTLELVEIDTLLTSWSVHKSELSYNPQEKQGEESEDFEDEEDFIQHYVVCVPDEEVTNAFLFLETASNPTSGCRASGVRVYEVEGIEYEYADNPYEFFNKENMIQSIEPNAEKAHDRIGISLVLDPSKIYLIEPLAFLRETEQSFVLCSDRTVEVFDFTQDEEEVDSDDDDY